MGCGQRWLQEGGHPLCRALGTRLAPLLAVSYLEEQTNCLPPHCLNRYTGLVAVLATRETGQGLACLPDFLKFLFNFSCFSPKRHLGFRKGIWKCI